MSVTLEQAVDREKTAEELLGELAHELSLLVRSELEVAAAERGPWLHRIAIELAASLGAAVAMLLALGAASLAAVEGLRLVLPGWLAALVVAVGWLGITALLLRVDHPRRLWRRLRQQTYEQTMATRDAEVVLKELMSILAAPWASRSQPARATPGRQCVKADGQMIRALRRRQGLPRGLRSKCIRLTSTAITVTR